MSNKNDDLLTDDYVAELLAKDAANCDLKYSAMGMEAFRSNKKPSNKPKPNTRFLKHIIKDTDTHNRALLAKESAESKARLEGLEQAEEAKRLRTNPNVRDIRNRQLGDIHAILGGGSRRSRRRDGDDSQGGRTEHSEGSGSTAKDRKDRHATSGKGDLIRHHDRDDRKRHHGRLVESSSDHKHRERHHRRTGSDSDRGERSGSHRRSHRDRHRSRSPSRGHRHDLQHSKSSDQKHARYRDRSPTSRRSRDDTDKRSRGDALPSPSRRQRRHRSPCSTPEIDTDPSDDDIGPMPAPKPRGRGALTGSSGIDRRFSDSYDPRTDVQMDEDEELEPHAGSRTAQPWDDAVEVFRDRQKLKQNQEARLRSAGLAESHIEKIKVTARGTEKSEADVRWAKAGEKREWDKGKNADGDIEEDEDLSSLLLGDM